METLEVNWSERDTMDRGNLVLNDGVTTLTRSGGTEASPTHRQMTVINSARMAQPMILREAKSALFRILAYCGLCGRFLEEQGAGEVFLSFYCIVLCAISPWGSPQTFESDLIYTVDPLLWALSGLFIRLGESALWWNFHELPNQPRQDFCFLSSDESRRVFLVRNKRQMVSLKMSEVIHNTLTIGDWNLFPSQRK